MVGTGTGAGTVDKKFGARNRNLGKMARFCHTGYNTTCSKKYVGNRQYVQDVVPVVFYLYF
jgi:hypothetical protein